MKIFSLLSEAVLASALLVFVSSCAPRPIRSSPISGPRWPTQPLRGANVSTDATEEDLRHFAQDWGGRVVRVLHLNPLSNQSPYAVNETAIHDMYRTTSRALDQGLAVVFAPGVAMENNDAFFSNSAYQTAFIEFWRRVAEQFKDDRRVIAYDLMNEPHDQLAKTRWSGYAKELTREIRKIDHDHTIIVEAPEWDWPPGFEYLTPTGDDNTIYSFHSYAPNEFTTQKTPKGFLTATDQQWAERVYPGSKFEGEIWNHETMARKLEPVFEFTRKNHVTIWCGEFGVARWAKGAVDWMRDMIDIFEAHHIGWSYYSYREWQVMDIEMSPSVKNKKTDRTDTDFVKLLKNAYSR